MNPVQYKKLKDMQIAITAVNKTYVVLTPAHFGFTGIAFDDKQ